MNLSQAIQKRILDLCHERGFSIHSLAKHCGLSYSTMQHIFSSTQSTPCVSTVAKICNGLNISLSEFFVNEVFRNLDRD